ncbi:hypothetical protein BSL78_11163 [Apostichopus japonicus]|uniref:Uncharacterized protein n=1 Tax=Stichopus japonicus TaxID=307972 RepID=A0A2G8KVG5_STIJA|nr:hypothetical protein BSL78_11163 [Apostichopus japonicus]
MENKLFFPLLLKDRHPSVEIASWNIDRGKLRRKELLNQAKEGGRRKRATEIQQLKLSFRTGNAEGVLIFIKSGQNLLFLRWKIRCSATRTVSGTTPRERSSCTVSKQTIGSGITSPSNVRTVVTLHMDDTEKTRNFNGLPHDFTGLELTVDSRRYGPDV